MNKAAFALDEYRFEKVLMDFSDIHSKELAIDFHPRGVFSGSNQNFTLYFKFLATAEDKQVVEIDCVGIFKFKDKITFDAIPTFFYRNCIAIIFPYVRSFVGTVTLQANIMPIMLPTMNLSSLEEPLKANTISE